MNLTPEHLSELVSQLPTDAKPGELIIMGVANDAGERMTLAFKKNTEKLEWELHAGAEHRKGDGKVGWAVEGIIRIPL